MTEPFWWSVAAPAVGAILLGVAGWIVKRLNQVHTLVNSQRTELIRQNAGLRAIITGAGLVVPPELRSQFALPPDDGSPG